MLKDRVGTMFVFFLLVISLIAGVYLVSKEKNKSDIMIEYNDEVSMNNAKKYISEVNKQIINELFLNKVVDGTYIVDNNKLINKDNDKIYYKIKMNLEYPLLSSIVILKDNEIKNATLYYPKETIIYKNKEFFYKKRY